MSGTSIPRFGARRIAAFGETVFARYSRLAQEHNAINLGQGFPDFDPPTFVLEALRASANGYQQYAPLPGMPELLQEIVQDECAALGRPLDPNTNVQVTVGATEGLFAAMQAFVDPGDEVLLIEPFYDAYPADVVMAGGVPRTVPLEHQADGSWRLDPDRLHAAITARTRVIVVNSPHNPSGKVFSADELDALVAAATAANALLLSDEVYEHIAFRPHVPLASRPGAWERTLTLHSFGKTFSATGWKVGWAVGPEVLIDRLRMAHQWIPFAVATPLQRAAAAILREARDNGYYTALREDFRRRRDVLVEALQGTLFVPAVPDGGYFVVADASAAGYPDDVALCLNLPARAGVAAIPVSAFLPTGETAQASSLIRFAFCKDVDALREAGTRLAKAF